MTTEVITNCAAGEGRQEQLMVDLRGVAADVGDLLNELTLSNVEEFTAHRTRIESRLSAESSKLDDARTALSAESNGPSDAIQGYIKGNRWKVIGIVVAAIVLIFSVNHS